MLELSVDRELGDGLLQVEHAQARGGWRHAVASHQLTFLYALALVLLGLTAGIPFEPAAIVLVFTSLLLVDVLSTSGVSRVGQVIRDWWPVIAVLVVYDLTRGVADTLGMPVHFEWMITADEVLFLGEVPTVWLQEKLIQPETQWWEIVTALVYLSHFFACFGLAAYLWRRNRPRWISFMWRFVALNATGMVTYILVPAAPPWLAAQEGRLDPVERTISRGWDEIGLQVATRIVEGGRATTNHVAAVPSLHAGYAFLFTFVLWRTAGRWSRPLLAAYPVGMGFTLVYSGEHYVIDILLGGLYAFAVHAILSRRECARAARDMASASPAS